MLSQIFFLLALLPIFQNGKLVYEDPNLNEKQKYCQEEFETLYPETTRIDRPHEYYVDLSEKLRNLKQELISFHQQEVEEKGKEYVKCAKKN